ncbi:MAG: hypothetical protein IPM57_10995 [Oligoflexia bacterium]|nr:hypothetical protein [Oligoflexia bacterium]
MTTQVDVQSTQQPLGISTQERSPQTQNVRTSFGLTTEKLAKGVTLNTKILIDSPDYSFLELLDRNGQKTKLSPNYNSQMQTEIRLSYSKGEHYVGTGFFGHISQSPYQTQGALIEYEKSFFNKTTLIGGQYSFFDQKKPEDYFNDRDGFFKARPLIVNANQALIYYEQVLSEKLKLRTQISTAHKIQERPRNYGGEVKLGYAFTNKLFGTLASSYFWEPNNQPLLNERGYFQAYINQLELTVEPIYDFFVSLSYGFSAEIESDPRSQTTTQVGFDQYSLGLKYNLKSVSVFVSSAYALSNSLTSSTKVSGGLSWAL